MSVEQLTVKYADRLAECLRCVICLQYPTAPIYCCQNEHLICDKCLIAWRTKGPGHCGLCMGEFTVRCKTLEAISECLCTVCPYGCNVDISVAKFDEHLSICQQRPLDCEFGCDATIPMMSNVANHLREIHNAIELESWKTGKFSIESNSSFNEKHLLLESDLFIASYDSHVFVMKEQLGPSHITYSVRLIGGNEVATEYRAKVSIKCGNLVNKLSLGLHVHSLREPLDKVRDAGDVAEIPIQKIMDWTEKKDCLPIEWEVSLKIRKKNEWQLGERE